MVSKRKRISHLPKKPFVRFFMNGRKREKINCKRKRRKREREGREDLVDELRQVDRLSQLPIPIIGSILSLLPIKEAFRSALVTKNWTNHYKSISHLVFDDGLTTNYEMWLRTAKGILNSRINPVESCVVCVDFFRRFKHYTEDDKYLEKFLILLGKSDVQKLFLTNTIDRYLVSSSSFSSFKLLNTLVLRNCILHVPSKRYVGLCCLTTLEMYKVVVSDHHFKRLLRSCEVLETLILMECQGFTNLKIHAPKLLSFEICSDRTEIVISFEHIPRLVKTKILYQLPGFKKNEVKGEVNKLIQLLTELNHVEILSLHWCGEFAKCFSSDNVTEGVLAALQLHVKELTLGGIVLSDAIALFLSCLLRSCPNLEQLVVKEPRKFFYEDEVPLSLSQLNLLNNLKRLTVAIELSDVNAHSFMLWLLHCCPNLQELVAQYQKKGRGVGVESNYWERQVPPDCLNHLMKVSFYPVCGWFPPNCEYLNVFVKFVLVNARVLKKISVTYWKCSEERLGGFVKELSVLRRASPDAALEFKCSSRDSF